MQRIYTPGISMQLALLLMLLSPLHTIAAPLPWSSLTKRIPRPDGDDKDDDHDPNDIDNDGREDDMESMDPKIVSLIAASVILFVLVLVFGSLYVLRIRRLRHAAADEKRGNTPKRSAVTSAATSLHASDEKGVASRDGTMSAGEEEIGEEDVMGCSWCYIAKDGLCRWCREAMEAEKQQQPFDTFSMEKGKEKEKEVDLAALKEREEPLSPLSVAMQAEELPPLRPLEPAVVKGESVAMGGGDVIREEMQPATPMMMMKHSFAAGKGLYTIA